MSRYLRRDIPNARETFRCGTARAECKSRLGRRTISRTRARSKARGNDCINKHRISNTQEFAKREASSKSLCFHIPRDLRLIGTPRPLSRSPFALIRRGDRGRDSPAKIAAWWRKDRELNHQNSQRGILTGLPRGRGSRAPRLSRRALGHNSRGRVNGKAVKLQVGKVQSCARAARRFTFEKCADRFYGAGTAMSLYVPELARSGFRVKIFLCRIPFHPLQPEAVCRA